MVRIEQAVVDFYGLQALEAKAYRAVDPFRRSHERWQRDFDDYNQQYTEAFARALFDYLALACFGEARHSWECATHSLEGLPKRTATRSESYDVARKHDPRDFLPKLVMLFRKADWRASYGGESWARIANAALTHSYCGGKLPDAAFVDHCIDLSHNGGLCFDKEDACIFKFRTTPEAYKRLLNYKRVMSPEAFIVEYAWSFSRHVHQLAERARNLGLITMAYMPAHYNVYTTAPALLDYDPIQWGEETLGEMIPSRPPCYLCGRSALHAYIVDGEVVCEACFHNAVYFCARCGKASLADLTWDDVYGGYLCDECISDPFLYLKEEEDEEKEVCDESESQGKGSGGQGFKPDDYICDFSVHGESAPCR